MSKRMIRLYTARPQKKLQKSLLQKTAFCFDYGVHFLWHCFDNLMQYHNIYFHPGLQ